MPCCSCYRNGHKADKEEVLSIVWEVRWYYYYYYYYCYHYYYYY